MKRILLTILIVGLWGAVWGQLYEDPNLYHHTVQPLTIDYGDSVWVNPRYTRLVDSLSILSGWYKWQRIDAIVDSVLAEM